MVFLASRLRRLFATALLSRAGAVALVTAICAPLLVIVTGFVADFSYASYLNQRLARATDDATVGAVSQTAATAAGGYGNLSYLQTTGVNYFNANTADLGLNGVTFSLSVVSDGAGGVTATGNYTYNAPTFFSSLIGIGNIPVSGSAKSSAKPVVYVNYYILVDTSQSMGIASTPAGMSKLYQLVNTSKNQSNSESGCVFGCHVLAGSQKVTNEALAHGAGIELRIDAAVTAVKSIITQAQSIASTTKNISFGLYEMQLDPATGSSIHQVASLSNDYASLQSAASTIDLGNNNYYGRGDSDFVNEFIAFNTLISAPPNPVLINGSGVSATSPLNYFFVITDGLYDVPGYCNFTGHCTGPLNPANCATLKTKGTVGVIYTTYNPIWDSNNPSAGVLEADYKTLVDPYASQIQPNLQSCASSQDFFFEASDGPDIIAAMQALFSKTQPSSARITQ